MVTNADPLEKPLTTKIKVIKEEDCLVTLSIELPKDEVAHELESVFQQIQTRASLPGFRVGKAPIDMVRKEFRRQSPTNRFGKT